jgi:hypothetical protein
MFSDQDWSLQTIQMRAPCAQCGGTLGIVTERNGQDVVRCIACGTHCYNRPKSESGKPQRSVRTRPDIAPSTKVRILERDNFACVICHSVTSPLHVGHLLSVANGRQLGASDDELYADDNLAAMCEECNLGLAELSVSPRLLYLLLQSRARAK